MSDASPQIPLALFGKDHWSLFAYVETRIVDYRGEVANVHLRADWRINEHRKHKGGDARAYPTRLKNGETASPHDDWSCIDDLVREGLLVWNGTGLHPIFALTEQGRDAAAKLRQHKGDGGVFATFVWAPAANAAEGSADHV
jgi:hypothetical protein